MKNCKICGTAVGLQERNCQVCDADVGYPNVRHAMLEEAELERRYMSAKASADARGVVLEFDNFEAAAASSAAVMNRQFGVLQAWLNDTNPFFLTFHQQVRAGLRQAQDNAWDRGRIPSESTINPHCHEEIQFAALTLDQTGLLYYGPVSIVLNSTLIADRASVFDENVFTFCARHVVVAGTTPPGGYRATWAQRGKLAATKLQSKLVKGAAPSTFATILMEDRRAEEDCDYVETHIYGKLHRSLIVLVTLAVPKSGPDALLWKQLRRKLIELNIEIREL